MELVAVLKILSIMYAVVFVCGYSIVYAFYRDRDIIEQAVMSGIFGMAQIFITFFLVKTFFVLGDAVWVTITLNIIFLSMTIINTSRNASVNKTIQ